MRAAGNFRVGGQGVKKARRISYDNGFTEEGVVDLAGGFGCAKPYYFIRRVENQKMKTTFRVQKAALISAGDFLWVSCSFF